MWEKQLILYQLTTHPLQTTIKLSFVANVSECFRVHCFARWTSPEVILFSGSFHLLQDPGYRVRYLASRTKCSVSAGTWYWWLYFLPVLGKHLPVKTGICRSNWGSGCCGFVPNMSALHLKTMSPTTVLLWSLVVILIISCYGVLFLFLILLSFFSAFNLFI